MANTLKSYNVQVNASILTDPGTPDPDQVGTNSPEFSGNGPPADPSTGTCRIDGIMLNTVSADLTGDAYLSSGDIGDLADAIQATVVAWFNAH